LQIQIWSRDSWWSSHWYVEDIRLGAFSNKKTSDSCCDWSCSSHSECWSCAHSTTGSRSYPFTNAVPHIHCLNIISSLLDRKSIREKNEVS
jgi:hypothetical protein